MDSSSKSKNVAIVLVLVVLVGLGLFMYSKNMQNGGTKPGSQTPELTQEERRVIVNAIVAQAKPATSITLALCKPNPEVASFKMNSKVDFKNTDAVEHSISFSPAHTFKVAAKSTTKIDFSFYTLPGIRHYTCDNKTAGSIVINK